MLLRRSQLKLHLPFAVVALVTTLGMAVWYGWESWQAGRWLGGGSTAGLACGVVSGGIIFFEMLLWPRKLLRRLRLIPAKYWLAAHLWLGLACFPLAIVHCGFHLGGYLPTALMVILTLVFFSGIYGWLIQNILPGWLLRNVPAETIYNQIDHVSEVAVEDVRRMITSACGQRRSTAEQYAALDLEEFDMSMTQTIVIGAIRKMGKTGGRTLETRQVTDARDDRDVIWAAFDNIEDFLMNGAKVESPVTDRREAVIWFDRLRQDCDQENHGIIEVLEQACEQRRQFDTQASVHRWLHGWIPIHVGLSVAVTILLIAHIWTALRYW